MTEEEQIHRNNSMRWEAWDYGMRGAYFVTANCKDHQIWFGRIGNNEMTLNDFGKIASDCWEELPSHFDDVELGVFVIMPIHMHGIIHLLEDHPTGDPKLSMFESPAVVRRGNQGKNTLSAIVGSFKSAVSRAIHLQESRFAWQPRFHDRVIRTPEEYERIHNYILNNPANWKGDEYYRSRP
jgi:putative transposase